MFRHVQIKVAAAQSKTISPSRLRQETSLQCFSRESQLEKMGVEDLLNLAIRLRISLQEPLGVWTEIHRLDGIVETCKKRL